LFCKAVGILVGIATVWLAVYLVVFYRPNTIRYLIATVDGAQTPQEELAAFQLVNEWGTRYPGRLFHTGYVVRVFDPHGKPFAPWDPDSRLHYKDVCFER
jgi:hypothetical protein